MIATCVVRTLPFDLRGEGMKRSTRVGSIGVCVLWLCADRIHIGALLDRFGGLMQVKAVGCNGCVVSISQVSTLSLKRNE